MKVSGSRILITPLSLDHTVLLLQSKERFHAIYGIPNEPAWPSDAVQIMLPLHYEELMNTSNTHAYGPCMIQLKDSSEIIGEFIFKKADKIMEIGYRIYPQYRYKGYATEAVESACNWLKHKKDFETITAICGQLNKGSQRILQRNNFQIKSINEDIIQFEKT